MSKTDQKTGGREDFEAVFKDTLRKLEKDAQAAGTNLTELCRETGVSRASPDRWKKQTPKTVRNVALLQRAVEAKREDQGDGEK